jgi:hypothetical protein
VSAAAAVSAAPGLRAALLGRTFRSPAFDYLLIGGGLSLIGFVWLALHPELDARIDHRMLMTLLLVTTCTHFGASTVRLYSMPGSARSWPVLTTVFPLVTLAVLTLCISQAALLGYAFQALYFTWSPYHYAAQTYGLALMYAYRSGCTLAEGERRWLRAACLAPFAYAFLTRGQSGLDWLAPQALKAVPAFEAVRYSAQALLGPLVFAGPLLVYIALWRRRGRPLPLISLLAMLSNGVWWTAFVFFKAFVWATMAHGVQYLAIVMLFHVKDRAAQPGDRHGAVYHALWFYGMSFALAYALFDALPLAYVAAGFGRVESMLMVVAAINVHHFIVDAFIWRFSKGGRNRVIVDGAVPAPA